MKRNIFTTILLVGVAVLSFTTALPCAASSLKVAIDTPPRTMNPFGSDSDANLSVISNLFDGLVELKNGKFVPALAEKIEHPDLLTWKFYLRKGVKFHNGNSFDAKDVKFSFERLADPEFSEFTNNGKSIDSIKIIDDYTVVLKTKTPIPWFYNNLYLIMMMDKESTENRNPGQIGQEPIGTGAYRLKEWVKGSYLKLTANEDYWGGAPRVKQVEIRPVTESSTRFAALVSGQADMVTGVPVELFDKLANNPKLEIVKRPGRRIIFLGLSNKPGTPTADIRVRKAMYMAVNEDEIVEKVMRGQATAAAQIPDDAMVGYNPDIKRLPYDPQKAKALLAEAGYENGFEITLAAPNDRYIQDEKIAEAVVKYLAKVGIKARLDAKPKSIFFPDLQKGTYNFFLAGWSDGTFDTGRAFATIIHTYDADNGFGTWNGSRFSDAEIDAMVASSSKIVDQTERANLLKAMNKKAMDKKIAWIPLHYQEDVYAIQKERGIVFTPRPDRWMVYKELSMK